MSSTGEEPDMPAQKAVAELTTTPVTAVKKADWSSHYWNGAKFRKPSHEPNKQRVLVLTLRLHSDLITSSNDLVMLQTTEGSSRKFSVHKALLCHFSPYFTSALNGNFSEAQVGLRLLATSDKLLSCFVAWLYTGKTCFSYLRLDRDSSTLGLVELYIFADRYDILALRRHSLNWLTVNARDGIIARYREVVDAYSSLPESSPLLRALEQTYICTWEPSDDEEVDNEDAARATAPSVFLAAVLVGIARRVGSIYHGPGCCCYNVCRFHEHESDEEREATCGLMEYADTASPTIAPPPPPW